MPGAGGGGWGGKWRGVAQRAQRKSCGSNQQLVAPVNNMLLYTVRMKFYTKIATTCNGEVKECLN